MREDLVRICVVFNTEVDLDEVRQVVADSLTDQFGPFFRCEQYNDGLQIAFVALTDGSRSNGISPFLQRVGTILMESLCGHDGIHPTLHVRLLPVPHRRFMVRRSIDHHGKSGIGTVLHGVRYDDDETHIHWDSEVRSSTVFRSFDAMIGINIADHEGSELVMVDSDGC